jgi:O-antigen/teichoic acid export membrane protein
MLKSLLSNSFFTLIFDLSNRFSWAILMILVGRRMGEVGAGIFALGNNYVFLLLPVVQWGLDQLLVKDLADGSYLAGRYFGNFLFARIVLALILWVGLIISVFCILSYSCMTTHFVALLGGVLISDGIIDLAHNLFVIFDSSKYSTFVSLGAGLLRAVGGAGVILGGYSIRLLAVVLVLVGWLQATVMILLAFRLLSMAPLKIDLAFIFGKLKISFPITIVGFLIATESQIGGIFLSFFRGEAALGVYGMANVVIAALAMLSKALRVGVFPLLARLYDNGKHDLLIVYQRLWRFLVFFAFLITAFVILFSGKIMHILYGFDGDESRSLLIILTPLLIFYFLNIPSARMMILANRQKRMASFFLVSTGVNLVASFLGARLFGSVGIASARIASMSCLFFLNTVYVHSRICSWSPWRTIGRGSAALIGMLAAFFLTMQFMPIVLSSMLSLLVYITIIILLNGVPLSDICWLTIEITHLIHR